MPTAPSKKLTLRSRSSSQRNGGFQRCDTGNRSSKEPSSRLLTKRSSSSATASSLESDAIVNVSVDSSKGSIQCKATRPQGVTIHSAKKVTRKSKVKAKTKPKKSKEKEQCSVTEKVVFQDTPYNRHKEGNDTVINSLSENLRWNCVCSDSEDEAERLKTYKENRRNRYAEAMQVKVMQRMTISL